MKPNGTETRFTQPGMFTWLSVVAALMAGTALIGCAIDATGESEETGKLTRPVIGASCSSDGDCGADEFCRDDRNFCRSQKDEGKWCNRDRQCKSGSCTDGTCSVVPSSGRTSDGPVRLETLGQDSWLQRQDLSDGTTSAGCGGDDTNNVRLIDKNKTGSWTSWQLEPADGEYFHVVSSADSKVLQATAEPDATLSSAYAVRMVNPCSGHWTQWKKIDAGNGYFRLENRATGLWLQGSGATDSDSGTGQQVRLVTAGHTGMWTQWREVSTDGGGSTDEPSDPGNPAQYTGNTHWDADTGTLTFTSNGTLPNTHHGWDVPSRVEKIVIEAGVRVTGRFDVFHTMTIEGRNRKTSELFGTPQTGYNKANDGCGLCKSAVYGEGDITVTVKNLTSRNPFGFHFTGKKNAKFVIDGVDAIDDRGGHGNNSDGVSAADGTIVRNSYFETGDDVIKVYADILVEDTTIRMVQNTVPIQFGWGSYGSGAKGTFRNLTVIGNSGRGNADNAMISARQGHYDKTIVIDGLRLENPNGRVMIFRAASGNADISITNALIDVEAFRGSQWSMNVDPKVCGTVYQDGREAPSYFDCR